MHFLPLFPFLLAVALAIPVPAPIPQEVNYEVVDEQLPENTFTVPATLAPTIISYDPTAAIQSVASDHTATAFTDNVAEEGIIGKRSEFDNSGCDACEPQPITANHLNIGVETDTAFLADTTIMDVATNAATPSGYTKAFGNLKAASNGYIYMGYQMINTYDPSSCATKCTSMAGCVSFNIYVERDPQVSACSATCQDPPAFPNFKCSYWGGALGPESAVNNGQYRNKFHVVIAGSNGYNSNSIPTVPGYSPVQNLGNSAINAPLDCNGDNTYMGYKLFANTPFDVRLCAAACDQQTAYNLRHPPLAGRPRACNFWNTYILEKNGISQGQYCSLYTKPWNNTFATNTGQYRGRDRYTISSSFSAYNLTSPGFPVCPSDVAYLNSVGGEFCASFNSYVAPRTTTAVIGTVSVTSTLLTTETLINTPPAVSEMVTETTTQTPPLGKRTVVPTPASITGWQASRISEACSKVATGTITDTTITSTSTIFVATTTDVSTLFSEAPTPVITITEVVTFTPTPTTPSILVITRPTSIVGDLNGIPVSHDDGIFSLSLPFAIGVFGAYSTSIRVTINGRIEIQADDQIRTAVYSLQRDLFLRANTPEGIYYQIDGVAPQRTVTIESYLSSFLPPIARYHFAAIFYEDRPGFVRNEYYELGTDIDTNSVYAVSGSNALRYSGSEVFVIPNETLINLDTIAGVKTNGSL